MKTSLFFISLLSFQIGLFAQTGIDVPSMSVCDTQITNFMNTHNVPGLSIALAKDGKLVYMRSFGNSNINGTEATQPHHMFRIASVSKPITSIGIMKMIEEGSINLSDQVFGTGGLLENHWYFSNSNITDTRVYDITIQHLLEHTAGWDRNVACFPNPVSPYPWQFPGCDPIGVPLHVTETFSEPNPVKEEHLIRYVLEKNLDYTPGTTYAYSNMGYLILSEIIEEISGLDYETYMRQEVFTPLGIYDMWIGKDFLVDKLEREAEYVGNGYSTLSVAGDGSYVPWEYGGFSVNVMDGHGGWIATARDLVRLLVAVDGFSTKPDILQPSTINTMSTASTANQYYAKGWSVNSANNWWHTGSVDGTSSVYVRTSSGYTWAVVLNKTPTGASSNSFWSGLDAMGWNCIASTASFPTFDLFEAPTTNAHSLQVTNVALNSLDLSWANGNGSSRIVVAKEVANGSRSNSMFSDYPLDGNDYSANSTFGVGDNLGDGSFVIYNGAGNSVSLDGLMEDSEYIFRVYEYTKNMNNGNNALYLLGNAPEILQRTNSLSVDENSIEKLVKVYPTVTSDVLTIDINNTDFILNAEIYNVLGVKVFSSELKIGQNSISVNNLNNGMYLLKLYNENSEKIYRFIKQ